MDKKIYQCVLIVLLFCTKTRTCFSKNDGWINIKLSHALDADNWKKLSYRGNITIINLDSGKANIVQDVLSEDQRNNFLDLAKTEQFYRVQATVYYSNGLKKIFRSSTRACSLLLSQLNDILWISVDALGYVNAITLSSASSEKCLSRDFSASELEDFNTEVLIRRSDVAPLPDTVSFIQKVDRDREAREKGDTRDSRGFLAKYWMYIVPVVLLLFISGATNQDK